MCKTRRKTEQNWTTARKWGMREKGQQWARHWYLHKRCVALNISSAMAPESDAYSGYRRNFVVLTNRHSYVWICIFFPPVIYKYPFSQQNTVSLSGSIMERNDTQITDLLWPVEQILTYWFCSQMWISQKKIATEGTEGLYGIWHRPRWEFLVP